MLVVLHVHTFHMWFSCTEGGQEASSSSGVVWHHLQHHSVGGGDEGAGPEGPTEATQLLNQARVTVVDVQVVVPTGGVGLHVKEAEREHDHMTLWDLDEERGSSCRRKCNIIFFFFEASCDHRSREWLWFSVNTTDTKMLNVLKPSNAHKCEDYMGDWNCQNQKSDSRGL